MSQSWGGGLQVTHRFGCPAFGVALQRLSSGLHQDDDEPCQRLLQQKSSDNGEHGDQVGGEAAGEDAAEGAYDDGEAGEHQARRPDESGLLGFATEREDEAGEDEAESGAWQ
jgi:hypothetical protein